MTVSSTARRWRAFYPIVEGWDYEPTKDESVAARAAAASKSALEIACGHCLCLMVLLPARAETLPFPAVLRYDHMCSGSGTGTIWYVLSIPWGGGTSPRQPPQSSDSVQTGLLFACGPMRAARVEQEGRHFAVHLFAHTKQSQKAGPFSVARLEMDLPFHNRLACYRVHRRTPLPPPTSVGDSWLGKSGSSHCADGVGVVLSGQARRRSGRSTQSSPG